MLYFYVLHGVFSQCFDPVECGSDVCKMSVIREKSEFIIFDDM